MTRRTLCAAGVAGMFLRRTAGGSSSSIVAKDFIVTFDRDEKSRGGDIRRGDGSHEYPYSAIQGDRDRAKCAAGVAAAERPSSAMIFRIVGPGEVAVIFEVPDIKPGVQDPFPGRRVLPPREPLRITPCED